MFLLVLSLDLYGCITGCLFTIANVGVTKSSVDSLNMQIDNLDKAFEIVKQKLFGRLHGILRKQIVERVPLQRTQRSIPEGKPASYFLPDNKKMNGFSSFAIPPEPAEKLSKEQEDDEKDKATISSRLPF